MKSYLTLLLFLPVLTGLSDKKYTEFTKAQGEFYKADKKLNYVYKTYLSKGNDYLKADKVSELRKSQVDWIKHHRDKDAGSGSEQEYAWATYKRVGTLLVEINRHSVKKLPKNWQSVGSVSKDFLGAYGQLAGETDLPFFSPGAYEKSYGSAGVIGAHIYGEGSGSEFYTLAECYGISFSISGAGCRSGLEMTVRLHNGEDSSSSTSEVISALFAKGSCGANCSGDSASFVMDGYAFNLILMGDVKKVAESLVENSGRKRKIKWKVE